MSDSKKKTPAEELIESLLKDVGDSDFALSIKESRDNEAISLDDGDSSEIGGLILKDVDERETNASSFLGGDSETSYDGEMKIEFDSTQNHQEETQSLLNLNGEDQNLFAALGAPQAQDNEKKIKGSESELPSFLADSNTAVKEIKADLQSNNHGKSSQAEIEWSDNFGSGVDEKPDVPMDLAEDKTAVNQAKNDFLSASIDDEKTVAVAGYQVRSDSNYDDRVKISVGQNRASTGYQSWSSGGGAESNLAQAENLRIAQEKILELEKENEKLRSQNEELMAASEIIKERSDLLSSQLNEYKNDREGLEDSYKSEIVLLKNHLIKKDAELQKAHHKLEELDSRLKFDMKKIRIRERELENRLELVRAEKNAIVKNKDEQILDLRRKMDVLQMEVESYRQKCVELNKSIESSQESFKRTTRALRLAMVNLELHDESKPPLKKVD